MDDFGILIQELYDLIEDWEEKSENYKRSGNIGIAAGIDECIDDLLELMEK